MVAAAEGLVSQWRAAPPGTVQPVDADMTSVTFRVISETMLQAGDAAAGDGLERSNKAYLGPILWPLVYAVLGLPRWLPFPGRSARDRAERGMRDVVTSIVQARRRNPSNRS